MPGMAAGLQARACAPGHHVALLGPDLAALVTAIQATWLSGATVVVLPLPMRLGSIEEFVAQTRARIATPTSPWCVVDADLAAFLEPAPGRPADGRLLDDLAGRPGAGRRPARPVDRPGRLAILQFTSGSTSDPKGVMLPHRQILANLDAMAEAADARSRRRRARLVAAALPRHGPDRPARPAHDHGHRPGARPRRRTSWPPRPGGWSG